MKIAFYFSEFKIIIFFSNIFFLENRELEGFLALKHLTKKIVSQNHQFNSGIEKAVFKQFRRVSSDTILGLVARILEIDEFVAVVDDADRCIGVITHLDLLTFAASDKKHAASVNGSSIHANGN